MGGDDPTGALPGEHVAASLPPVKDGFRLLPIELDEREAITIAQRHRGGCSVARKSRGGAHHLTVQRRQTAGGGRQGASDGTDAGDPDEATRVRWPGRRTAAVTSCQGDGSTAWAPRRGRGDGCSGGGARRRALRRAPRTRMAPGRACGSTPAQPRRTPSRQPPAIPPTWFA